MLSHLADPPFHFFNDALQLAANTSSAYLFVNTLAFLMHEYVCTYECSCVSMYGVYTHECGSQRTTLGFILRSTGDVF